MKILALDQSSRVTGYSIWIDNNLISYGKFTADQENIIDRLSYIKETVKELINDNSIEKMVLEDIQLQKDVVTFKILAEVYGVLSELGNSMKILVDSEFSSSWKSGLNIKGKTRPEQKRNAQLYVKDTFGIEATQDECDAICIGSYYVNKNNSVFDWS